MNSSEATDLLNNNQKLYYDGLSGKVWVSVKKELIGITAQFGVKDDKIITSKWYPNGISGLIDFMVGAGILSQ